MTSRLEHPSVLRVAEALQREGKAEVYWARALPDGRVDVEDIETALAKGRVRLRGGSGRELRDSGVVQPVSEIIEAAHRAGARVHVDAVQAFGRTSDVAAHADTRSLAAHKMRGPKSIGALLTRPGVTLEAILLGGSQERGLRPGTVDPVAAAGLAAAATRSLASPPRWAALAPLRDGLEARLLRLAPRARVNGALTSRMPHVSSIAFPGWRGPDLVAALWDPGGPRRV